MTTTAIRGTGNALGGSSDIQPRPSCNGAAQESIFPLFSVLASSLKPLLHYSLTPLLLPLIPCLYPFSIFLSNPNFPLLGVPPPSVTPLLPHSLTNFINPLPTPLLDLPSLLIFIMLCVFPPPLLHSIHRESSYTLADRYMTDG